MLSERQKIGYDRGLVRISKTHEAIYRPTFKSDKEGEAVRQDKDREKESGRPKADDVPGKEANDHDNDNDQRGRVEERDPTELAAHLSIEHAFEFGVVRVKKVVGLLLPQEIARARTTVCSSRTGGRDEPPFESRDRLRRRRVLARGCVGRRRERGRVGSVLLVEGRRAFRVIRRVRQRWRVQAHRRRRTVRLRQGRVASWSKR